MISLGWGDPIESPIMLVYRRKGEEHEREFIGPVAVIGEDRKTLTWLRREDLPLADGRLDLTKVPVVAIGGKRKHQPARAQGFLEENPSFQGAILLYPGTGQWDLGEGMLFVTSREILSGKRVSGGKPEVQLTNHRWLRDGRYVADRSRVLHGKVLEMIEAELEQEPGAESILQAIAGWTIPHRLRDVIGQVTRELHELEGRRVMLSGEKPRDMTALVREHLLAKLKAANVRFVRDIPAHLTVTAEEIAPDLVAQAETLGTIEIPGIGRRLPRQRPARFGDQVPTAELSIQEFRTLDSWPFAKVFPVLTELGDTRDQLDHGLRDAVEAPEAERLGKLREYFSRRWLDIQRSSNRPKDEKVADPRETDPPATPEPLVWGFDLMTGSAFTAYPALVHSVCGAKGRIVDSGWSIRWYDDPEEAAKADAEARREAESYITARRLEAELTAGASGQLPVQLPGKFTPAMLTLTSIMERLGFKPEQFRVEGQGPLISSYEEGGYYSEIRESFVRGYTVRTETWARREGDLIVVFSNATSDNLLAARKTLGVTPERVAALKAELQAESEQAEANYREQVRQFVEALKAQPVFNCLPSGTRARLEELANSYGVPDPSRIEAELRTEWAKACELYRRSKRGEILVNFGGHFRVMGATGQAEFWVIRPDGAERHPDEVEYRKRYTSEGQKTWRLVGPRELAISWFKGCTAAPHRFVVNKLPANGCTSDQLATVERLEREISERFQGAVGMSGTRSPDIGDGWNLGSMPKPTSAASTAPVQVASMSPVEGAQQPLSGEALENGLAKLKAKFGGK